MLVAGFQGVSTDFDITTLGRGGSDTTAVALAAALGARGLRDLHRRRRRLHRRPAARPERAQAARRQLRRDARAGGVRREGAAATLGRVRAEPRRQAARALDVLADGRARGSARRTIGCSRRRSSPASRTRARRRVYRVDGHDAPRGSSRALADAGVNVDTIVQTGRRDRLLRADRRPRTPPSTRSTRSRSSWSSRDDLGKVSVDRRRNEEPSGRRGEDVRDARARPGSSPRS